MSVVAGSRRDKDSPRGNSETLTHGNNDGYKEPNLEG